MLINKVIYNKYFRKQATYFVYQTFSHEPLKGFSLTKRKKKLISQLVSAYKNKKIIKKAFSFYSFW